MTAKEIHTLLVAIPFKAFRIQTTRTGSHEIHNPTTLLLTRSKLYITVDHDADGIAGDVITIPIAQISTIKHL